MKRYIIPAAILAVALAFIPGSPARSAEPPVTLIPSTNMTLELPEGWLDIGEELSQEERLELGEWRLDSSEVDTIANNLGLDTVCWVAVSPDGTVAYMNIYGLELGADSVSVSGFSPAQRKQAADWAASDYGLDSANSVAPCVLGNLNYLLVQYGDPEADGFYAYNYLFVYENQLCGLEFVSGSAFTEYAIDLIANIAASLDSGSFPPVSPEAELRASLPIGSEYAWVESTLGCGVTCLLPDWMTAVDAADVETGLSLLKQAGAAEESLSRYRTFFERDPELAALFVTWSDYHGYILRTGSALPEGSRIDDLGESEIRGLISQATANGDAPETVLSSETAYYGGIPMLRILSREQAGDATYYMSYLFLADGWLYTLTFLEEWEFNGEETGFFDRVAAGVSLDAPGGPARETGSEAGEGEWDAAALVILAAGAAALVIIGITVAVIMALARRQSAKTPAPAMEPASGLPAAPAAAESAASASPDGIPNYCIRCGAPLGDADRFCSRCGSPVRRDP